MHTTWPGDVHTLLLGAGSFVALMVVYAHRMADVMLAYIVTWPGDVHCYLVLAHL